MNPDLFLAILALDSYNRGYGKRIVFDSDGSNETQDADELRIGNADILNIDLPAGSIASGFYAAGYSWNGETIVSYRGTDGLNDVTKGWTIGAGWTDQKQANLAIEFYKAATGRDAFDVTVPTNITLTGHSLGGGLAGFVSMISGAKAAMFDHMPFGRAATDTYTSALEALAAENDNAATEIAA